MPYDIPEIRNTIRSSIRGTLHPDEEVVDGVVETFFSDLKDLVEFMLTNQRPLLQRRLTPDEELARFRDPIQQPLLLAEVQSRDGLTGMGRFVQRMYRLMEEQEQKDLRNWRPEAPIVGAEGATVPPGPL